MPPALYWYKPSRLIQRANRRCYWLLNLIALALPWRWQATYRTAP